MRTFNASSFLRGISALGCTLALSALTACGSGGGGVGLEIGATQSALSTSADSAAPLVITDLGGAKLTLSQARVHLRDIKLHLPAGVRCADVQADLQGATCSGGADDKGPDDSSGEDEIRVAGPFVVDLLTRTATPDLASIKLPRLAYSRIDLRIDDAAKDGGLVPAGDPLADHSWLLEAQLTQGGKPTTLSVVLDFNEDLRIEAPGGVTVEDGASLLIGFDVATWLGGVDLGKCVESGDLEVKDDTIHVDDSTKGGGACGDLEGQIKDGIKGSGHLEHGGADDGPGHG